MYVAIRCCFNIIIVTLSIISSSSGQAMIVWYCFSPVALIYNYWLDFVHDWDISISCCEMKRDSLLISKKSFLPFRIGYFFLRAGWVLHISPNIIFQITSKAWLLIVTGIIELCRRLIWNILRVEKEHLINCREFRVKTDNKKK